MFNLYSTSVSIANSKAVWGFSSTVRIYAWQPPQVVLIGCVIQTKGEVHKTFSSQARQPIKKTLVAADYYTEGIS